jgi:hypothetical protein
MPVTLPSVAAPIVKPLRVMVKVALAEMPVTAVVITIEVAPGTAEVADVEPATLTTGVVVGAKNPAG